MHLNQNRISEFHLLISNSAALPLIGAQIDLLIDRADQCINICEMKYSVNDFAITKSYAAELERKMKVFREQTKTRKTLFLTMITSFGVKTNDYKINLVQNELKMDSLFA